MKIEIYNQSGILKTAVSPSDNSTVKEEVMGDKVLNLSFTLPEYVSLEVNDYIDFSGERYTLLSGYEPVQKSSLEYEYTPKFYGIIGELRKAIVVFDGKYEAEFALDGTPAEHVRKIVDNINRIKGTEAWTVGTVLTASRQTIEYKSMFCIDALAEIAKTFDTEWWVEGTTINLCKCEHGTPVELGYRHGLIDMGKKDAEADVRIITRLIPLGSTRNIDKNKYGYARLQLPDRSKYVERNTHYGIYESVEEESFAGIYPHRLGTVGSVRQDAITAEDGTPRAIYYISDNGLDFNPNEYELGGLKKHIIFQNGDLGGRDFEVDYHEDAKEFEIINQYPNDDAEQIPGGNLIPRTGDTYILYNIRLPDAYYPPAEAAYKAAVDKFMEKYSEDVSVYKGNTDYIYLDKNGITLTLGRRVRLLNDKYFKETGYRDSRVTSLTRNVNIPSKMYIECSYAVGQGRLASMEASIAELRTYIADKTEDTAFTILKTWDSADPSNYNVISALRAYRDLLSKRNKDTAAELITFAKGIIANALSKFLQGIYVEGGADFDYVHVSETLAAKLVDAVTVNTGYLTATDADINILDVLDRFAAKDGRFSGKLYSAGYIQAMLGWTINADGSAEMKGLRLREFLEVPELRYNRISVITGEQWSAPGGGIIESADEENCILYLKLEPGELAAVEIDDICKGTFNNDTGFQTAFFRITEKLGDSTFKYALRSGYAYHPQKAMHFVAYGNFTNKERQASAYITLKYTRYLKGVNTWEMNKEMVMMQFGDLSNLKAFGIGMEGYSAYLKNIYLSGTIKQLSSDGVTETPVPAFKGEWKAGTYYPNDEVTHNGSTWLCISERHTAQEPSEDSTDWLETSAKGKDAVVVEVFSSNGNIFRNGEGGTVLTAHVRKGGKDVTGGIPPARFSWEKESSNADTDAVFNETHAGYGSTLEVTPADVYSRATFNCIVNL